MLFYNSSVPPTLEIVWNFIFLKFIYLFTFNGNFITIALEQQFLLSMSNNLRTYIIVNAVPALRLQLVPLCFCSNKERLLFIFTLHTGFVPIISLQHFLLQICHTHTCPHNVWYTTRNKVLCMSIPRGVSLFYCMHSAWEEDSFSLYWYAVFLINVDAILSYHWEGFKCEHVPTVQRRRVDTC